LPKLRIRLFTFLALIFLGSSLPAKYSKSFASQDMISNKSNFLFGRWETSKSGLTLIITPKRELFTWKTRYVGRKIITKLNYEINTKVKPYQLDIIHKIQGKEIRQKTFIEFSSENEIRMYAEQKYTPYDEINIGKSVSKKVHQEVQPEILRKISNQSTEPTGKYIFLPEEAKQVEDEEQKAQSHSRSYEALNWLDVFVRSQQAYRFEHNQFASSTQVLDANFSLKFYNINILSGSKNNSYAVAIPKESGLRSYSVGIWQDGDSFYHVICESKLSTSEPPKTPQRYRNLLTCPLDSIKRKNGSFKFPMIRQADL
jgi:hypothetical protein